LHRAGVDSGVCAAVTAEVTRKCNALTSRRASLRIRRQEARRDCVATRYIAQQVRRKWRQVRRRRYQMIDRQKINQQRRAKALIQIATLEEGARAEGYCFLWSCSPRSKFAVPPPLGRLYPGDIKHIRSDSCFAIASDQRTSFQAIWSPSSPVASRHNRLPHTRWRYRRVGAA
jgi:hypothetical protein